MQQCCQFCRYYSSDDGLCRRFPRYVEKRDENWCGEFKPQDEIVKMEEEYCPTGKKS